MSAASKSKDVLDQSWKEFNAYLRNGKATANGVSSGTTSSSSSSSSVRSSFVKDLRLDRAIAALRAKNAKPHGPTVFDSSHTCTKACSETGETDMANSIFLCKRSNNVHVCSSNSPAHPWTYVDEMCQVMCGATKLHIGVEYENSRAEVTKKRGCDPHRWYRGMSTKRNYERDNEPSDNESEEDETETEIYQDIIEDAEEEEEEVKDAQSKRTRGSRGFLQMPKDLSRRVVHADLLQKPIREKTASNVMHALSYKASSHRKHRKTSANGFGEHASFTPQKANYVEEMRKRADVVLNMLFNEKHMKQVQEEVRSIRMQKEKSMRSRYMHTCRRTGTPEDTHLMREFGERISAIEREQTIVFTSAQCNDWLITMTRLWILLEPVFIDNDEKMNKQFYVRFVLGALYWTRVGLIIEDINIVPRDDALYVFPCYQILLRKADYATHTETSGSKLINDGVRKILQEQSMYAIQKTLHPESFQFA